MPRGCTHSRRDANQLNFVGGDDGQDIRSAAIEEASSSQAVAMESGDFAAWSAVYGDEFLVIPPGAPPVTDPETLSRTLAGFTAQSFALTTEAIEGCRDLAVKRGGYSLTYVPEGASDPISDVGHYVEIWRREAGGWKLSVDIWNSTGAEAASQTGPAMVEFTGDRQPDLLSNDSELTSKRILIRVEAPARLEPLEIPILEARSPIFPSRWVNERRSSVARIRLGRRCKLVTPGWR